MATGVLAHFERDCCLKTFMVLLNKSSFILCDYLVLYYLVLVQQGGPGCASMFGNLYELGPYRVNDTGNGLEPNPGSWNRIFGLIFIDQPLGTGFSRKGQANTVVSI